ncbi:MAG: DUF5658 family protein [Pseudomonadota bacterium]
MSTPMVSPITNPDSDSERRSEGGVLHECRREGPCRRTTPFYRADWRWAYRGRRRGPRRLADASNAYVVDWYPPRLVAVVIGIFLLSALDATLTLELITRGIAVEGNPILAWVLELYGAQLFVNTKTAFTGACLVFLAAFSHEIVFSGLRVRSILYILLGCYVLLIGYEILMLTW